MARNHRQKHKEYQYLQRPELSVVKNELAGADILLHPQAYPGLSAILSKGSIKTAFINPPIFGRFNRAAKRIFDLLFSTIIIITVLSWLTPIVAILIKLTSKGPVFFLQKRNKRNGAVFTCIKFRSMVVNDEADILPAGRSDRRITRLGRFLRDNYIDEIPQFFNVFVGDMSVIGPRPHMISDNLRYSGLVDYYDYRHKIKPGITGLAQVMGYVGNTANLQQMKDRLHMDIFYMRHWSMWMDMVIIFRTFTRPFYGQAGRTK